MRRVLKYSFLIFALAALGLLAYGTKGYLDAIRDTDDLRQQANVLIAKGRGGRDLGAERLQQLLQVQDPAFDEHGGVDFTTLGAGATTVSQSVSKRLAFNQFRPGVAKIRQTGYALGLEQRLSKDQIFALWLDTLEMGRGPDGWMTGFYKASDEIYGRSPADLSDVEFLRLVAVLIAPAKYDLRRQDTDLEDRVRRIESLVAGRCTPLDHGDVWLDGCRQEAG